MLDSDAHLLEVHSEKEGAAPNRKRGVRVLSAGVLVDATGEALAPRTRVKRRKDAGHGLPGFTYPLALLDPAGRRRPPTTMLRPLLGGNRLSGRSV